MEQMSIKEAAKQLSVEAHVLRYWEDELGLTIKRNRQGHRYYDEKDIHMFQKVQELKEQGYLLKDVRDAISRAREMQREDKVTEETELCAREMTPPSLQKTEISNANQHDKVVDFKQAQLQAVMNKVVATAFQENKDILMNTIKEEITADVMRQFDTVMREKEEKEEQRYRKLDEVLRQLQQSHLEVAATKVKKRRGFHR